MLIHHELREFENGNHLFDGIKILHITSYSKHFKCPIGNPERLDETINFDHQYVKSLFRDLIPYVDNIVQYIAGFISHKLHQIVNTCNCNTCKHQLIGIQMPLLSMIKKIEDLI